MAQHGDANVCISFFSPQIGQSRRFRSHHDGGRSCHRSVVIEAGVLQLCSQYLYAFLLEESDTFLCAASHTRNREERSYCRTDEIGVVEVGQRVTDYDCISPSCIGTSKYCSEVSRLFHALQDHDKWRGGEFQIGKPRVSSLNHSHYSFRSTTIGDSFERQEQSQQPWAERMEFPQSPHRQTPSATGSLLPDNVPLRDGPLRQRALLPFAERISAEVRADA